MSDSYPSKIYYHLQDIKCFCAELVIDSGLAAGGTTDIPSFSILLLSFLNSCESVKIYSHMKYL